MNLHDLPDAARDAILRKAFNLVFRALERTKGGMESLGWHVKNTPEGKELAQVAKLLGVEE